MTRQLPRPNLDVDPPLRTEVEQFLYYEARCIDEQRWDDWLSLYAEDSIYWAPTDREQSDPLQQVSIYYETKSMLQLRTLRWSRSDAHSLDLQPQSTHLVSNIMLDEVDSDRQEYRVYSSFTMVGFREDTRNTQTVYAGSCYYFLTRCAGLLCIKEKKIILNNCEAPHSNIQLFF